MRPRHKDPTKADRQASAPFNFVRLPEAVFEPKTLGLGEEFPDYSRFQDGRFTGTIDLKITAETPLYIRCGPPADQASPENERENPARRHFFHHGDPGKPVIPGSSLRGMVRTLVEVLSFGKLQWFTDRRLIFRAVGDTSSLGGTYRIRILGPDLNRGRKPQRYDYPSTNVQGGYLERTQDGYAIRPAQRYCGESIIHIDYKDVPWVKPGCLCVSDVYVKPEPRQLTHNRGRAGVDLNLAMASRVSRTPGPGLVHANLVVSGHIGNFRNRKPHDKHMHCAVYDPDPAARLISIPKEMWERYEEDASMTRGLPTRVIQPGEPLFYRLDANGQLDFFGPTLMFRLPYQHTISDFVPEDLRDPAKTDLAEQIFGTVLREQGESLQIRGRVAFEDAMWIENEGSPFEPGDGFVTPKILGTPKPTAFQEYLTQSEPDRKEALYHYGSSPRETVIRGHKFYWHKRFDRGKYWENRVITTDTQHTVIRPVKAGTMFKGKVRFENLSVLELGALLTALQLPNGMRHKLGMGKPLAMGTVRIDTKVHLFNLRQRYSRIFTSDGRLETGELPEQDTQRIVEEARATFARTIVAHHNHYPGGDSSIDSGSSIWDVPRLQDLRSMLTWDPDRADSKFDYPPPALNGGIDGKSWRERKVIPTPAGVLRGVPSHRIR